MDSNIDNNQEMMLTYKKLNKIKKTTRRRDNIIIIVLNYESIDCMVEMSDRYILAKKESQNDINVVLATRSLMRL